MWTENVNKAKAPPGGVKTVLQYLGQLLVSIKAYIHYKIQDLPKNVTRIVKIVHSAVVSIST